jgi:hypothetical protein
LAPFSGGRTARRIALGAADLILIRARNDAKLGADPCSGRVEG